RWSMPIWSARPGATARRRKSRSFGALDRVAPGGLNCSELRTLVSFNNQEASMALQIGDVAPDFEADTTEGQVKFHSWLGDSWGVLVSHPKDFTPVCTTELGLMAKLKPEFDKRNAKVIGISVDAVDTHKRWSNDIKETQGYAPNYPMIGDPT